MTTDILIIANVVFYGWALHASLRSLRSVNPRYWLRVPATFISGYIFVIYFLAFVGVIPEMEIRFFMRWFQLVIAAYITLEARYG